MLNHIVVMGRLTRDPELRTTQTGTPVVSFTVAVDRDFADRETGARQTDFIDVVAWRSTAEFIARNFGKGDMAIVMGRLQLRDWTDKEGQKRRNAEIVADTIHWGETRQAKEARMSSYGGYTSRESANRYDNYAANGFRDNNSSGGSGYQSNYGSNQGGYGGNSSGSLYSGGNQGYGNNGGGYQSSYQQQQTPSSNDYNNTYQSSAPVENTYTVPASGSDNYSAPAPSPKVPDTFQELDDPELPF